MKIFIKQSIIALLLLITICLGLSAPIDTPHLSWVWGMVVTKVSALAVFALTIYLCYKWEKDLIEKSDKSLGYYGTEEK